METLCKMVQCNKSRKGQLSTLFPKMKSMLSNFSTLKKLGKDKIVERLYFFHNILGDGYGLFGKKKSNQLMKVKTINIVIQIKALAEILQKNTGCNPGKPGNGFIFNLPKDKPLSGNNSSFLYHFAALLKEMLPEFEKNVVEQLKFT
ncbi:Hypothetical predicted protein [Paramuricea clavata]|nr:Hypothetical predicted protein [Paramuricea clavata]